MGVANRTPKLRRLRALRARTRGEPDVELLVRRGLQFGQNAYLAPGVVVDPEFCHLISIGEGASIGPCAIILAHDASMNRQLGCTRVARVSIGARVFIGAGSIVLPGVSIGDDTVVGAGSVVSVDLPAGVVAVGTPARPVLKLEEFLDQHRHASAERPRYSKAHTASGGIMDSDVATMLAELGDGPGYIWSETATDKHLVV